MPFGRYGPSSWVEWMKIGYVGLGAMGSALSRWLVADHRLTVLDRNAEAVGRLTVLGATASTSLPDMARDCEAIFLCLPRSADVHEVLFGASGLCDGLTAGKLVIDQTSGDPGATVDFARRLAGLGVTLVDAPVAGGVPSALAGKITIMASGPDDAYDRILPAFRAITPNVYRASDRAGDGQAVKMINNMVNSCNRIATLELVALGRKLGLSMQAMIDALDAGIGANFTSKLLLKAMNQGKPAADFALALMIKDANQAIAFGTRLGVPMPVSSLARGVFQMNLNMMGPETALDDVGPFMEKLTGIRYRDPDQAVTAGDPRASADLIANAVAACNRVSAYENLALGTRFGLSHEVLASIVNNGSGWSRELESIAAELSGSAGTLDRTLGSVIETLQLVEELGRSHGVPLFVSGEVRAILQAWMNQTSADAPLSDLAGYFERVATMSFNR